VDNTNGAFSDDELARIQDTVAAVEALVSPYGANIIVVDTSVGLDANIVLDSSTTSTLGGMADGILGVTTAAGEITIIQGWNWYAGADAGAIGSGQYDFQTVITHELGHSLGLGHSSSTTSVMYPQLATAAARRDMLLADLNTAEEGDGGAGLHAEALVAAGAKSQAHAAVVATSSRQSAPDVTILSSAFLPLPSAFGNPSASTKTRSNPRNGGRNALVIVAGGARGAVPVITANNSFSELAAMDLHDMALEHFLTNGRRAGRRFLK
jgi:hypothetical protein